MFVDELVRFTALFPHFAFWLKVAIVLAIIGTANRRSCCRTNCKESDDEKTPKAAQPDNQGYHRG
jgi:hypothetical protein